MTSNQLSAIRKDFYDQKEPEISESTMHSHIGKLLLLAIFTRNDIPQNFGWIAVLFFLRTKSLLNVV